MTAAANPDDITTTTVASTDPWTVIGELRRLADRAEEFGSVVSPHRSERLRALARISGLAAQATLLEIVAEEAEDWRDATAEARTRGAA